MNEPATGEGSIPIRDVSPRPPAPAARQELSHRWFLFPALVLALFGGLLLALLQTLAGALEWRWGARWQELAQAHGQLQLLGFAGLYVMGMAFRLMPRFSGRSLAYPALVVPMLIAVATGVVLRSAAPLFDSDALHSLTFVAGGLLVLAGSLAFVAIIWRTVLSRSSRAEATGWFLVLGSADFAAGAVLHLVMAVGTGDMRALSVSENNALIALQLYGFVMMFIAGIATRAVATLVGRPRSAIVARVAAVALFTGTAVYAGSTLWSVHVEYSVAIARSGNAGLLLVAAAFILTVWATGVFQPTGNRVAAASQTQFFFVRSALAWLAVAAALIAWHAADAIIEGNMLDQFGVDAIRHVLTIGVITMLIVGMSMLVVPEFGGRRLQHPNERVLILTMVAALNVAVALRIWPPIEGTAWLSSDRYWPMAISAALTMGVIGFFTAMFVQSYLEQRAPGWASTEALAARK